MSKAMDDAIKAEHEAIAARNSPQRGPFKGRPRLERKDLDTLGDWLGEHGELSAVIAHDYTIADLVDDLAAIGAGIYNERVDLGLVDENGDDATPCKRCGGEKFIEGKEGRDGSCTTGRPCPDCNR